MIAEFSDVIKNLVSQGISGIRVRNVPYLLVNSSFENENIASHKHGFNHVQYGFYTHSKTENLPGIGLVLNVWKKVLRNLTTDGPLMVNEELLKLDSYKVVDRLVVDLPVKEHIFEKPNATFIAQSLNYTFNIDNIEWPLWKVSYQIILY